MQTHTQFQQKVIQHLWSWNACFTKDEGKAYSSALPSQTLQQQQHVNSSTVYRHWQKAPLMSACRSVSQNAPFHAKPPHLHVHQIKLRHTWFFNFFQSVVYLTLFINFSFLFFSPALVCVMVSLSLAGVMLLPVMDFVLQETSEQEKILIDHNVYYTQW